MARCKKHPSSLPRQTIFPSVYDWDTEYREDISSWDTAADSSCACPKQEVVLPASEGAIDTPAWTNVEQKDVGSATETSTTFTPSSIAPKMEDAHQASKCTSVADETPLDMDTIVARETSWDSPEDEKFLDGFKNLLDDSDTSDVGLYSTDGYMLYAHWLILNMRTDCFHTMYRYKEDGKDVVETSLSGRILWRMIQYIYTGDYDTKAKDGFPAWGSAYLETVLEVHASVYSGAQEYQIRGLTNLCAKKFEEACNTNWSSDSFCSAIRYIYSDSSFVAGTKNDKMKEVAIQAAVDHGAELRENASFKHLLTDQVNGFAGDLVLKMFPKKREDSWATHPGW